MHAAIQSWLGAEAYRSIQTSCLVSIITYLLKVVLVGDSRSDDMQIGPDIPGRCGRECTGLLWLHLSRPQI